MHGQNHIKFYFTLADMAVSFRIRILLLR